MGIQINGQTDTITAIDGSFTIQGATLPTAEVTNLNATGIVTAGQIFASSVTISGNISVAGTVTYEDVTNVDSIGVITARSGIVIGTGTSISSPSSNTLTLGTNNSEVVRLTSTGRMGVGKVTPLHKLEVAANPSIEPAGNIANFTNDTNADFTITCGSSGITTVGPVYGTMALRSNNTEAIRIASGGQIYVGQYANAYDNPGRFNISNGSRVSTTSGAYVPSNGGFVDYARYELISTCVTSFPANNNKIMARNGAPLTIGSSRSTWSHYNNLPNYLIGTLTHDNINDSSFTFTLSCTMTVFLLRDNGWNAVDLTGWSLIESGTVQGVNAIGNGRLYVKTLAAGSHALSNNSAMYFWLI